MASPEWRTTARIDRSMRVRTLPNGDFLVNVIAGAVTMAITLSADEVATLFPPAST